MDIIYKRRGRGATADLIRLSALTGYPIVAPHSECLEHLAKELGVEIPRPIPLWYIETGRVKPEGKVLVDDMEYVVKYLTGLDIDTATLTAE